MNDRCRQRFPNAPAVPGVPVGILDPATFAVTFASVRPTEPTPLPDLPLGVPPVDVDLGRWAFADIADCEAALKGAVCPFRT